MRCGYWMDGNDKKCPWLGALQTTKQRLITMVTRLKRYTREAKAKRINGLFAKDPAATSQKKNQSTTQRQKSYKVSQEWNADSARIWYPLQLAEEVVLHQHLATQRSRLLVAGTHLDLLTQSWKIPASLWHLETTMPTSSLSLKHGSSSKAS